jgi:phosphohistidine phosphatase SixA
MRRIILVRHGRTGKDKENPDRKLTKSGIKATVKAAVKISKYISSDALILSSPKPRAMQTAEIFSKHLGDLPIKEENLRVLNGDAITEEVEAGRKVGISAARTYLSITNREVESPSDAAKRLEKIISGYPEKDLVLVGHEGFLEAFLTHQTRFVLVFKDFDEFFDYSSFAVFEPL